MLRVPQDCMSCGGPTDQKLFTGYISSVRMTAALGGTWKTPGNHIRSYFDLRVVEWSTIEGLGLSGEAASLPGQPPQRQSQATP